MPALKHLIQKAGLEALYFSGASKLLRPLAKGVGAVLMLHRVRPRRSEAFQPNEALEVTPRFLERTIKWLRHNGYEFISMDEMRTRLVKEEFDRRFVTITLDDGYRDNKIWAQPILAKYGVPYTIYVPTDFADGVGHLWWLALESIVADNDRVDIDGCAIACSSVSEKLRAYATLQKMVVDQPSQADEMDFIRRLTERYRYDQTSAARSICLNWAEIQELARDPLATIGAHTVTHPVLAKEEDSIVRAEFRQSRDILQKKLQTEVRHLAYPYGSADAVGPREFAIASEVGYETAVTTRPGVLTASDAGRLMELPRINLDGKFQRERHLDALLSGVAPAVWNGIRSVTIPVSQSRVWACALSAPGLDLPRVVSLTLPL